MFSWTTIYFLSEWLIRLAMLFYVPQRRSPSAARGWLLFVFVLPWPGLFLYAILGRPRLSQSRAELDEKVGELIESDAADLFRDYSVRPDLHPRFEQTIRLASNLGRLPIVGGNQIELLPEYDASIARLVADIDEATDHVHLLYYIFADDRVGTQVIEALRRAVARGIPCRVLLDALGSKPWLDPVQHQLHAAGVDAVPVLPVGLFRRHRTRMDLRNHRKIAVIDGRIGYVGSQNLVASDFKPGIVYKELVARVVGPVVLELQTVFLADYYKETKSRPAGGDWFPRSRARDGIVAQVLPSGPGFFHENIPRFLVALLYSAKNRVILSTPYFVPDGAILQAMRTAVQRGVEVHLIVSRKPDQILVGLAQRSYYQELLEAGVRIYEYLPGLLHAKHVSIDDDVAIIGSANLDIRSFELNAEVLLLLYDRDATEELVREQRDNISDCEELTVERWSRRPFWRRFAQNVARLFDSVL